MATTFKITKAGAAIEQLEWAIKLLVEENAYIPAITLAGAAEEILGKMSGNPAFHELRDHFSTASGLTLKAVADGHLNRGRNWFKHWSEGKSAEVEIELETDAIQYIARGLINAARVGHYCAANEPFAEWLAINRPDLCA